MAQEDKFPDITQTNNEIYRGFLTFVKISGAATVAVLALMAIFLV